MVEKKPSKIGNEFSDSLCYVLLTFLYSYIYVFFRVFINSYMKLCCQSDYKKREVTNIKSNINYLFQTDICFQRAVRGRNCKRVLYSSFSLKGSSLKEIFKLGCLKNCSIYKENTFCKYLSIRFDRTH